MLTRKVVLVTGGSGMVGRALQEVTAAEEDHSEQITFFFASSKDGDLTDLEATRALFDRVRPTHVIHLAAYFGGVYEHLKRNLAFLRLNHLINDHVLQVAFEHRCSKVISCSSTCIFPAETTFPVDESMIYDGEPHASNLGYATAKRYIDILNRAYNEKKQGLFTSLILPNLFGPHGDYNIETATIIPSLIHKVYLAGRAGGPVDVWGSGAARRQFLYTRDVARLLLWALEEYAEPEPLILAPDEDDELTVKEVVQAVVRAQGFRGEVRFDLTKSDGLLRKTASNAKMRRFLPEFQLTPFRQALQETVTWFIANYDTLQK